MWRGLIPWNWRKSALAQRIKGESKKALDNLSNAKNSVLEDSLEDSLPRGGAPEK